MKTLKILSTLTKAIATVGILGCVFLHSIQDVPSFAEPFYSNYYFPSPPPKKSDGGVLGSVLGGIQNAADAVANAANTVANSLKSITLDAVEGIKDASNAIYHHALIPIKNVATSLANRVKECGYLAQDSADLAAEITAKNIADGALIAANQVQKQALAGTTKLTEGVMIIPTSAVQASNQTVQGVLIAADATAEGILTGVEKVIEEVLQSFEINKLSYHGNLRDLAKDKLGSVQCTGKIVGQPFTFTVDIDLHNVVGSVQKAVEKIVGKMEDEVKSLIKIM